eukprot:731562_1
MSATSICGQIDELLNFLETMSEEKKDNEDKGPPKIILGSMEFGRRLNEKESHEIIESFLKSENNSNKSKEIDSAYMYQGGKSESYLGNVNKTLLTPNNALIATKACPKHEKRIKGLTDEG